MSKKKTILFLSNLTFLFIAYTLFFYFTAKEKKGFQVAFLSENQKQINKTLKKADKETLINQLIFIETDSEKDLRFSYGAVSYKGIKHTNFQKIKTNFDTLNSPLFANLLNDGLCRYDSGISRFKLEHFFANSDSSSVINLNNFVIDLNKNLGNNLHVFSHINLLPLGEYDSDFYEEMAKKAIITTQLSEKAGLLNAYFFRKKLKNINDTLKFHKEIESIKKLIKNRLPVIIFTKPSLTALHYFRNNLLFRGLIVSDFRNAEKLNSDEIIEFVEEGNSMFLVSENTEKLRTILLAAAKENDISKRTLKKAVKPILLAKEWTKQKTNTQKNIRCENSDFKMLLRNVIENSITLVKNDKQQIPIKNVKDKILSYNFGDKPETFYSSLRNYAEISIKSISEKTKISRQGVKKQLLIVNKPELNQTDLTKIKQILEKNKVEPIIVNFGKVQNLSYFDTLSTIVQAYGSSELEQDFTAQGLLGGMALKGSLPAFYKEKQKFPEYLTSQKTRLKYSVPEEVGMNTEKLKEIDSLIAEEISSGTFPGCQVFVARKGVVIFNKSYGFHTYSLKRKVKTTDLYDLASLTKVSATTIAAMKMYDQKKINLKTTLGDCVNNTKIDYTRIEPDTIIRIDTLLLHEIPNLKKLVAETDTINLNDSTIIAYDTIIAKLTPSRNIFKVKLRDMLVHQSGIMPVLPILPYLLYKIPHKRKNFRIKAKTYKKINDSLRNEPEYDTIYTEEKKLSRKEAFERYFSKKQTDSSEMQIARNMYFHNTYRDTLWIETKQLNVAKEKRYQYSDVNMILVQMGIDSLNDKSIDEYLDKAFYKELGLKNTCFLPLKKHKKSEIVPTAYDKIWRNQLLHGYVHDPSAAILGGIAGNAGLFSNAHEIGILFQMLLNGGTYGGKRYLSEKTIELFTHRQKDCVRALGFEMQSSKAIMSRYASKLTYGHTGFTGNCVWVDPKNELVFVFVSNRVHPSARNGKINSHRVRQRVHDIVYESFLQKETKKE